MFKFKSFILHLQIKVHLHCQMFQTTNITWRISPQMSIKRTTGPIKFSTNTHLKTFSVNSLNALRKKSQTITYKNRGQKKINKFGTISSAVQWEDWTKWNIEYSGYKTWRGLRTLGLAREMWSRVSPFQVARHLVKFSRTDNQVPGND